MSDYEDGGRTLSASENYFVLPKYLFRYLRDDVHLIETLTTPYLWFSDPKALNDPFDLTNVFGGAASVDDVLWYMDKYGKCDEARKAELKRLIESGDMSFAEAFTEASADLHNVYLERIGVCCFSFRNDSLLMWSHYGAGHTGVCLVIHASQLVLNHSLIEVQYRTQLPKWNLMQARRLFGESLLYNRNFDQVVLGTKYKDWSYEEEYRLISNTRGKNVIDGECIAGIICGARMSQTRIDEITAMVTSFLPGLPVVHAKLDQSTGSVVIPAFTNEKRVGRSAGWRFLTDEEGQPLRSHGDPFSPEDHLPMLKGLPYPGDRLEVGAQPILKIHRGGSPNNPGPQVAVIKGLITEKGLDLPSNSFLFNLNPATGEYLGATDLIMYLVTPGGEQLYAHTFDITAGKPNPLLGY
jgi:Protein of unknown function (DUF2971)